MNPAGTRTPSVVFTPQSPGEQISFEKLFGRTGPVEIEVGCGKGRFLLNQASQQPERLYIGIEFAKAYLKTIDQRVVRHGLENVRATRYEAGRLFHWHLPDHSVSAFHLLYPDPWPKKKHHKRRLIQHRFLSDLRRVLQPGALINIATDHQDYFVWMEEHFAQWRATFVMQSRVISKRSELDTLEGRTNYETKYIAEGRTLHYLTGYRTGF